MNIVVLTNNGSLFGKKLLNELKVRNVPVQTILIVRQPLAYYRKLFGFVRKRVGIVDALYFSIKRIFFSEKKPVSWKHGPFLDCYEELASHVVYTHGSNSEQTWQILQALKPDLVLLGQTGIIGKHMLKIPSMGMLNSHTGVLPQYRGMDCPKWAILADDFENIGCSVHWVDKGIDTGPIILKKTYVMSDTATMETLENNLTDLAVTILADVTVEILENKQLDSTPQILADGKQYFKMSRVGEALVRKKLSAR